MLLHELNVKLRKSRRIGRGGKRGNFSGRGFKGQKSRSGRKIRPAERDLLIRIPKLRGYKNLNTRERPAVVNLEDIASIAAKHPVINAETLLREGLIGARDRNIKVLGRGDVKKPLEFRGLKLSKSAKDKIIAAGGKVL